MSVGLDVNYRENMPLISNFTTINGPLYGALAGTAGGTNLIGEVPGHGETGLARGKTLHVVLNGLVSFGATPLWNASSLAVEGAMTHLVSVDKGEQTFKGDASYEASTRSPPTPTPWQSTSPRPGSSAARGRYHTAAVLQRWPQGQLGRAAGR